MGLLTLQYRRRRRLILLFIMLLICYAFWKLLEPKKEQTVLKPKKEKEGVIEEPQNKSEEKVEEPKVINVGLKPVQLEAKPEYKCRYRSSKFAPIDRNLISPRLQSVLKRYVRLHDAQQSLFGVEMSAKSPLTWGNNTARFIVWKPHDDGNVNLNFKAFLGSLMLAVLTDRVILTTEKDQITKYFCDPLKSNWRIKLETLNELVANSTSRLEGKRTPVRSLLIEKNEGLKEALSLAHLKYNWEPVQFVILDQQSQPESLLWLLKNEKSFEAAWYNELFPGDGMAIPPLYHSWMHPVNDVWDLHKSIIQEMAANHHVIVAFVRSKDDCKSLVNHINVKTGLFILYLTGINGDEIQDTELKALYPKVPITTSWHYYKSNEAWGRLALDLQMANMKDVELLVPFESPDASPLIAVNRRGKTLAYNKKGKVMPVAPCDYYSSN